MSVASYPGSKTAMGVAQRIISAMPVHDWYVEGFGGTGAIARRKRPAARNWIIEKDPAMSAALTASMPPALWSVIDGDFFDWAWAPLVSGAGTLMYLDPPYVLSTRRSRGLYYRYEWSDADHERLAEWVTHPSVKASIIISGYTSRVYENLFGAWRREEFTGMTRYGPRVECIWMNFPPPTELHDARFSGIGFTDRQRIKRKAARWAKKFEGLPEYERAAILEAIHAKVE